MALGTPRTNKFHIGEAEIRIGTMDKANKLTQSDSLGLLQGATVSFNQESVDLEGGLPKTLVDTAITRTVVNVNAQAYEYSRRNIRAMLNEGAEVSAPSEYAGTVATAATTADTTIDTDILLTDVTVGDMLVIYPSASPQNVSVVEVTAKSVINTDKAMVTIDTTKTPLLFNVNVGDIIFKANQIGLGNSTATNYFTLDIIGQEHSSGRPIGFKFWKAAVGGGMEYAFSSDNFAVTPITFKILNPSAAEYGAGGDLNHLSDIIPTHPYGMYIGG